MKKRPRFEVEAEVEDPFASFHNELLELEADDAVRCEDCG